MSDPDRITSRDPPLGGFRANGKTIKLKKWDGKDEAKYYTRVEAMVLNLRGGWKQYPRMTLAIDRIFKLLIERIKRNEIPRNFDVPHIAGFNMEDLSADERAYLKGFAE